jgi:selenocysteine lyase/cysteine desulfurase
MGMVALHAAISLLQEVGIDRISQQVLHLVGTLIDDLSGRGYQMAASTAPEHRSGIVVVQVPDAASISKQMMQDGVIVIPRGAGIRIAPHFYNTHEEVLRVGELFDTYGARSH